MREQDRLRVLEMGHARRRRVADALRLLDQRSLQLGDTTRDLPGMVAKVEPQVCRDLVVAAASRTQLAAEHADPLEQAPLECGVHVLVLGSGPEETVPGVVVELVERDDDAAQLVVVEQPCAVQHARMRS